MCEQRRCVMHDTPHSSGGGNSWIDRGSRLTREKSPEKNARPAAEIAAYGVLEGGRAISGVSTCVSVAVFFTLRAPPLL